jgi:AcrR family transcriptional regulator
VASSPDETSQGTRPDPVSGPSGDPDGRDTKERILDAAEALFASSGFSGASLRSITTEAGANLAAVNYHFGSKDDLIQAVFARRLTPLNQERLRLLDSLEAEAGDGSPELEDIVRAFLTPALRLAGASPTRRVVMGLLGQAMSQPDEKIRGLFVAQFSEVGRRFQSVLARAVPALPAEEIFWRLMFMIGAMVHSMTLSQNLEEFSGGLCSSSDVRSIVDHLVPFVTAGMLAPAASSGEQP